jgi:hypothetical protein
MFESKPFSAKPSKIMQRFGQLIWGLCVVCFAYILFAPGPGVRANQVMRELYQSSPLSPLAEPAQASTIVTNNVSSAASTVNRTSQTSLLLVAIVLVGILVVIALVMWRQR